jgi:hypothetical protein
MIGNAVPPLLGYAIARTIEAADFAKHGCMQDRLNAAPAIPISDLSNASFLSPISLLSQSSGPKSGSSDYQNVTQRNIVSDLDKPPAGALRSARRAGGKILPLWQPNYTSSPDPKPEKKKPRRQPDPEEVNVSQLDIHNTPSSCFSSISVSSAIDQNASMSSARPQTQEGQLESQIEIMEESSQPLPSQAEDDNFPFTQAY